MKNQRKISNKEKKLEFAIGIFFFFALFILGTFTIIIKKDVLLGENEKISVDFFEVGVLQKGNKVLLRGYEIGRVESLEYINDTNQIRLNLNLAESIDFYQDYQIVIRESSMLGGRYIYIDPGTPQTGVMSKEGVFKGTPAVNLMEEAGKLIKNFQDDEKQIRTALVDNQVASKITEIVDNINEVSANLKNGQGTLGKLINDATLYTNVQNTIDDLSGIRDDLQSAFTSLEKAGSSVDSAGISVRATSDEIHDIIKSAKNGEGTLGKFLNDDQLYKDLQQVVSDLRTFSQNLNHDRSSLAKMINDNGEFYNTVKDSFSSMKSTFDESREIVEKLKNGEGTMGKLIADEAIYLDAKETIQQVRNTINDLREQAPISTFASFIFGAL
jgi:phospholipid/cholesterol/gamma-HCH transport system substrate-binding protein